MRYTSFETLKGIIASLKPAEIVTAKKFIKAFSSNFTAGKNKGLALFNLLCSRPDISKTETESVLNNRKTRRAFNMLVERLGEKLPELLLLNRNLQDEYSPFYMNLFDVRKKIMVAQILRGRGNIDLALNFYNEIISRAKKFELYDEIVEALHYKKQLVGLSKGTKPYLHLIAEAGYYEQCRKAVIKARDIYYHYFAVHVDFKGINRINISELKEKIIEMVRLYRDSNSARVAWYLFTMLMEYFIRIGDYKNCCLVCSLRVSLVRKNYSVYVKRRLGQSYFDLADNELFVGDFNLSCKHALMAQHYSDPKRYNFQLAKETEFKALFYMGDIERAENAIEYLLKITRKEETPFHFERRTFYKACLQFVKQNFAASFALLRGLNEIKKDSEGWNMGVRLLKIMNLVEMNKLDDADSETEALRKHIQRLRLKGTVRERERCILKILCELEKSCFDFLKAKNKTGNTLSVLNSDKPGLEWEVKSYEMIIFNKWFEAKVNGMFYSPFTAVKMRNGTATTQNIKRTAGNRDVFSFNEKPDSSRNGTDTKNGKEGEFITHLPELLKKSGVEMLKKNKRFA